MRYEKKIVSEIGATIELYITGITLHIPKGAFQADTVVELGTLDQSTTPKIETDLGEVVLSDIIKIGPASATYNVPAILSIPHSVSEVPKYSSIRIIHFDEDAKVWVPLSHPSELQRMEENYGYVTKSGLYALCLLLDTDSHCIGRATAIVRPFDEETGVELTFDEDTFDTDQTAVDVKLNTFTEIMCKEMESAGFTPSVIIHVNVQNDAQPNKPVSIASPIPVDLSQGGKIITLQGDDGGELKEVTKIAAEEIMILQGDDGDDLEDVTKDVSFHISGQYVVFKVDHFSK